MVTHFTETFLNDLVFKKKLPDSWDFSHKLFDFLEKENLSISTILSPFNLLCKSDISALIKKTIRESFKTSTTKSK